MAAAPAPPPAHNPGVSLAWDLLLQLSGGAVLAVQVSRVAGGHRNAMAALLNGTAGAVRMAFETDQHAVERCGAEPSSIWQAIETPVELAIDYASFPRFHFDRLVGALRGEETFPDFAHALRVQAVLAAAEESARLGRSVAPRLD
jgi:predicted dehydrogenase